MRAILTSAVVLLLTALAFVPQASAIPHPCDGKPAENTCHAVVDPALELAGDYLVYAVCYYNTAPAQWTTNCL